MSINLSQKSAAARAQERRDRLFTRGVIIVVLLLLITAGAYVGLRTYTQTLEQEITAVENRIAQRERAITGEDAVRIADALFRNTVIREYYVDANPVHRALELVASVITPAVTMTRYGYALDDEGSIVITADMETSDLLSVALQVAAMKAQDAFHSVAVSGVQRDDETNMVQFTATIFIGGDKK